jgi:hypothetical protein
VLTDENGLPVLDQFSEEGFVDCVFRIENLTRDGEHFVFELRSSYRNEVVGVRARLKAEIGPGIDAEMNIINEHVYWRGLEISSLGPESDRFVAALGSLYGAESIPEAMVQSETFTVIALQQDSTDLESKQVRLKIFGNDGADCAEDDYYEAFFNVDLPGGFVYWNEKDGDYREPMLKALAAV